VYVQVKRKSQDVILITSQTVGCTLASRKRTAAIGSSQKLGAEADRLVGQAQVRGVNRDAKRRAGRTSPTQLRPVASGRNVDLTPLCGEANGPGDGVVPGTNYRRAVSEDGVATDQ
jgi:hypothetical protein